MYKYVHVCSISSRNFAYSIRCADLRQHALLRTPVFASPTLHAVLSRSCQLMIHCSNFESDMKGVVVQVRLSPRVSRSGNKWKRGKSRHFKGGGVHQIYKLSIF